MGQWSRGTEQDGRVDQVKKHVFGLEEKATPTHAYIKATHRSKKIHVKGGSCVCGCVGGGVSRTSLAVRLRLHRVRQDWGSRATRKVDNQI